MSQTRELSALAQLLLTIGLMLGGLILTLIVAILVLIPLMGFNGALEVFTNPTENIAAMKTLQIIQGISLFIVPAYFFGRLISGHSFRFLKLDKIIDPKAAIVVILIMLAAIPFINLLGFVNSKMVLPEALSGLETWMKEAEARAAEMTVYLVSGKTIGTLLVNLLMIAIIPALGEEMLFRGVLQPIMLKAFRNVHIAVVVTAFVFSAFHMQFYGFLPRFFIGIILGYLFVYCGSLWLPILAHFINNATATIAYFMYNQGIVGDAIESIGTGEGWTMGALSAGILMIIYFYIERNKVQLKLNEFKQTPQS